MDLVYRQGELVSDLDVHVARALKILPPQAHATASLFFDGYCPLDASRYAFHTHCAFICPDWNGLQGFGVVSDVMELEYPGWADLYARSFPTASVQVHVDLWHASLNLIPGLWRD